MFEEGLPNTSEAAAATTARQEHLQSLSAPGKGAEAPPQSQGMRALAGSAANAGVSAFAAAEGQQQQQRLQRAKRPAQEMVSLLAVSVPIQGNVLVWPTCGGSEQLQSQGAMMHM